MRSEVMLHNSTVEITNTFCLVGHHHVYAQTYLKNVWRMSVRSAIYINSEEWFTTMDSCRIATISGDKTGTDPPGRTLLAMLLPYSAPVPPCCFPGCYWRRARITLAHNSTSCLYLQLQSLVTCMFWLRLLYDPSFRQSKSDVLAMLYISSREDEKGEIFYSPKEVAMYQR